MSDIVRWRTQPPARGLRRHDPATDPLLFDLRRYPGQWATVAEDVPMVRFWLSDFGRRLELLVKAGLIRTRVEASGGWFRVSVDAIAVPPDLTRRARR